MKDRVDIDNPISNPPDVGCVLYLPGLPGGGSSIYDRSPYGNTGTITGATWKRLPSGLWCLDLDGADDYVNCGNGKSFDITGSVTLEAWVNTSKTSGYQGIIMKRGGDNCNYGFGFDDTYLMFVLTNAGWQKCDSFVAGLIPASTWCHYVVTFNESNVEFYVNGNLKETKAHAYAMVANNEVLVIGTNDINSSTQEFEGYIALPRIYNHKLSGLKILNHFNREKHLFGVW